MDPLLALQEEAAFSRVDGFGTLVHDFTGQTSSSSPPDTTGDVGPNHFVQAINASVSTVRVLDKATGAILRTFTMQSLASASPCSSGFCDPVVVYDQMANRWLISELPSSGGNVCVYVSTTPDPLGTWYAYAFPVEASLPDFPKFGLWPQNGNGGSYMMGANAGTSSVRDLFAFDRAKMLAGLPATFQKFSVPRMPNLGFQLVLPSSVEGSTPPPNGEPAVFMRHHDDEALNGASTPGDMLDWWTLSIDWSTPANSALTLQSPIAIADYDITLCGIGSPWAAASAGDQPAARCVGRSLPAGVPGSGTPGPGGHLPRGRGRHRSRRAARFGCARRRRLDPVPEGWWEAGGVHRSIGSIGMDQSGIALGYTRTGNALRSPPSITAAAWPAVPGTMPQGECHRGRLHLQHRQRRWDAPDRRTP